MLQLLNYLANLLNLLVRSAKIFSMLRNSQSLVKVLLMLCFTWNIVKDVLNKGITPSLCPYFIVCALFPSSATLLVYIVYNPYKVNLVSLVLKRWISQGFNIYPASNLNRFRRRFKPVYPSNHTNTLPGPR